jgi:hypothetical protein
MHDTEVWLYTEYTQLVLCIHGACMESVFCEP